jgi:hypothetical protein
MKATLKTLFRRLTLLLACLGFLLAAVSLHAADTNVQLDTSRAGPRQVESLSQQSILRDYRFAWTSLEQALEFNNPDPLEGPFVGKAKQLLADTIASQQHSGLRTRYLDQKHKLQAVFYAPEGDVIELHDTAEYQIQVLDGDKAIHDEHVVMHYVVLMTPAADRWVIRQLLAVPQF